MIDINAASSEIKLKTETSGIVKYQQSRIITDIFLLSVFVILDFKKFILRKNFT